MVLAHLGRRGQISIEFILLVMVALIYINAVIVPMLESSSVATADVKATADTKIAATKLANAVNEVAMAGGNAKKTILLFLPDGGSLECNRIEGRIDYRISVAYLNGIPPMEGIGGTIGCVDPTPDDPLDVVPFECSSYVQLLPGAASTLSCTSPISGPILRNLVVKKEGISIAVNWES